MIPICFLFVAVLTTELLKKTLSSKPFRFSKVLTTMMVQIIFFLSLTKILRYQFEQNGSTNLGEFLSSQIDLFRISETENTICFSVGLIPMILVIGIFFLLLKVILIDKPAILKPDLPIIKIDNSRWHDSHNREDQDDIERDTETLVPGSISIDNSTVYSSFNVSRSNRETENQKMVMEQEIEDPLDEVDPSIDEE
jgi:hypothetical protein